MEILRERFEPVLKFPGVVGLAIATRADCLPDEVCGYLEDLSRRTDLNSTSKAVLPMLAATPTTAVPLWTLWS